LGKREKFLLLSFLLSAIFFGGYFIPRQNWISGFFPIVLLLMVAALGLYLLFPTGLGFEGTLTATLPLLFCLSMGFVQLLFSHTSLWFRVFLSSGFLICFYFSLLVLNVFLVARKRGEIPLLRPAKTALFLLIVLTFFLGTSALLKGIPLWYLQLGSLLLFAATLSLDFFYFLRFASDYRDRFSLVVSFLIAFLVVEVFLALGFFPQKSFFRALSLAAIFYSFLGTAQAYSAHRMEKRTLLDFLIIFLLGLALFWLFPRW